MIQGGYTGKILRVNLTERSISIEHPPEDELRKFIGCSGYAVKMLWDELEPGIDPLDPDNKIIYATGPIAGTLCPSGGSYELCYKSPLTGAWNQSRAGGSFGPKLKYAGFDFLVIEGKAEQPVYLWINNNEVEIRSAAHIWGKGVEEATVLIQNEVNDLDASIALIGPAGENLVLYAAVINDRGRAAGRGGGGAVMGSKNLKGIAVNGSLDIAVADPDAFHKLMVEAENNLKKYPFEGVNQFGTPLLVGIQNAAGALPTKNFSMGQFDKADQIGGEALTERYLIKRRACFGCSMGCGRYTTVADGKFRTPPMEGPEYETLASLGSLLLNDDLESLIQANYLCNDYGLDTISVGVCIAFAMECFEKGLIPEEFANQGSMDWGNPDTVVDFIHRIAHRKGIGNILADGVKKASEAFGSETIPYSVEVKGMEVPMHEPRGESKVMALQYAVNPRGACHMHPNWAAIWDSGQFECGMNEFGQPWPPTDKLLETKSNKGLAYRYVAIQGEISEIVGACVFHSWGAEDECLTPQLYAKMISALTGWDVSAKELFEAADRSWVLKRAFNLREGFTRLDDRIPEKLKQELPDGVSRGSAVKDIDGMLREYYTEAGWDADTGVPSDETLDKLGLSFVIDALSKRAVNASS